jgi:hypothetical protein
MGRNTKARATLRMKGARMAPCHHNAKASTAVKNRASNKRAGVMDARDMALRFYRCAPGPSVRQAGVSVSLLAVPDGAAGRVQILLEFVVVALRLRA